MRLILAGFGVTLLYACSIVAPVPEVAFHDLEPITSDSRKSSSVGKTKLVHLRTQCETPYSTTAIVVRDAADGSTVRMLRNDRRSDSIDVLINGQLANFANASNLFAPHVAGDSGPADLYVTVHVKRAELQRVAVSTPRALVQLTANSSADPAGEVTFECTPVGSEQSVSLLTRGINECVVKVARWIETTL